MLAEMALQNLNALTSNVDRILAAEQMKGIRSSLQSVIPIGRVLIHETLLQAEDTTELLAIRGYVHGGTCVPVFTLDKGDIVSVAAFF